MSCATALKVNSARLRFGAGSEHASEAKTNDNGKNVFKCFDRMLILPSPPNALVQLQAHLTMGAQRAIQKCLSAATFVRQAARKDSEMD